MTMVHLQGAPAGHPTEHDVQREYLQVMMTFGGVKYRFSGWADPLTATRARFKCWELYDLRAIQPLTPNGIDF